MSEALAKVKKELGANAVILHTRTVNRGGVLGVGARPVVEITATSDGRAATMRRPQSDGAKVETNESTPQDSGLTRSVAMAQAAVKAYHAAGDGNGNGAAALTKPGLPKPKPAAPSPTIVAGRAAPNDRLQFRDAPSPKKGPPPATTPKKADDGVDVLDAASFDLPAPPEVNTNIAIEVDTDLRNEIDEIRRMVKNLVDRSDRSAFPDAPESLTGFYSHLISQEVEEQLARELLHRAAKNLGVRGNVRIADELVRMELRRLVGDMLPAASPLKLAAPG
ncbi:MAG: hypothetical protein KDA33_05360, partial [Phycisphaerales bacterium]|nr:hypothetical protein [Phycisphaerales bacterium]